MVRTGANEAAILADLDGVGQFGFNKFVTIFTGTISPRNMDGLIINSMNSPRNIENQVKVTQTVRVGKNGYFFENFQETF